MMQLVFVQHCRRILMISKHDLVDSGILLLPLLLSDSRRFYKNSAEKKRHDCNSTASFSSSSSSPRKSTTLHNYYIRKRRKWPVHPYQTQWLESFASKLAKRSFKLSIKNSKTHLLSDLINAFAAYETDPTPQSFHFLFKILIQNRPRNCHEQISQVLNHIQQVEKFETPECIFVDLIRFYGDNDMFDDAVELFLRIPRFRCVPSVDALNALLILLCKDEKGLQIVPRVLVKSQELSIMCYNLVLEALVQEKDFSNADKLFDELLVLGLVPDICTYNVYINGLCMQDEVEDGIELMGSMEELGCLPDSNTFDTILRALCEAGKQDRAIEVVNEMTQKCTPLNPPTCEILIDGFVGNGDLDTACMLLENNSVPQSTSLDKMLCWMWKKGLYCVPEKVVMKKNAVYT